ncbi:hypothetical protein KS664_001457 [Clostridium perfringens]|nr:hypothetical protein [Clostridium perfringens]
MGMGWKNVSGGIYSTNKCKCGKGKLIVYISDHEESDYPPFERDDEYSAKLVCPNNCMDVNSMSQDELKFYSSKFI